VAYGAMLIFQAGGFLYVSRERPEPE